MYCYPVIPSFVQMYGWNLPNVERLSFRNGNGLQWSLKTIPVGLFNWASGIKYLSMYNIGLEDLKCDIFQPLKSSLNTLDMQGNLFREFPSCALKNMNRLETIYFSYQNIESVNIIDLELNSLKYITLRRNKISNFSISNINNYNDIQILLDYNKISYLNISGVNRISYLHGKENQISEINHGIFHSSHSNLVYLDLSYNALNDDVWNVLEGVASLKTLKLKQNKLHTVRPSVLNRLSALYELDLSNNYITSFADVLLRSGTMRNVLLNSNTLLNFPSNVIDDTKTFGSNYDCTIDISNNRMDNIKLDIPTTCTRFTLNLGQNELTAIHFKTNDKEIESLNISSNRLVTLPTTLPKAKRYIISNNPLMTTNVLKHLTTTMKDATQIDMDNINFLCNRSEHYDFTNLQLTTVSTFSLRGNCIPLAFVCYIRKSSNIVLYLDNNKNYNATEDMPCELHTKDLNIVSFSGSIMNETNVDLFMSKYTKTISHVTSLYLKNSQIRELSFIRYATLSRYSAHVFDFSENFLEVFNGLEIITNPYHFTLNIEHNQIIKIGKITIKRTDPTYHYQYIYLKYMNNSIDRVNDSLTLIDVVGGSRGSSIYVSVDLSLNRIHILDLAKIVIFNNDNSYLQVQNLNVSNNDLEEYCNCLQNEGQLQILDLTYNQLRDIPDNSCRYGYHTYLGHNIITTISKTLPTVSISKLDLEWNLIQYISEKAFTNMSSLRTLNLRGNRLKNFPKAVQKLHYLTTLDISYNEIINIKQSDIDGMINSLNSLILTGNDLASNPSTSIGLLGPVPSLELKDNLIYCDCSVQFLRNSTLKTQGRCSFPPEFEGHLVSCFPADNCVGNVPIYIYKETKLRCLNDDYFDVKISVSEDDENRLVSWKRIGPKNQKSLRLMAYREQIVVKEILINGTGQTYCFVLPSSLNVDRLCVYAFLEERTFKRCLDVISTYIKSRSVSETDSNNGAVYGTSTALVLSVLVNIFGSIFIFVFIKRTRTKSVNEANSNRFDNNAYVPNEYEMSSYRRGTCDQQAEVYDELSENCYNTGKETYENLNIGNVRT
ncbi:leucine-rich repeat and death domain-containing protein 1-like [Mytilus edulis]|uniref:leucine-rich repeat and death domain-containing protein 1-like n=1 Tax=Mytilus edulis TaxID=6550 RepID=UPI0039F0FB61